MFSKLHKSPLETSARALRPLMYSSAVPASALTGILLFVNGGTAIAYYAATDAGFTAALAAMGSGDVVWLPAGTISGAHTVPAGGTVIGRGLATILTGQLTLGASSDIRSFSVIISGNSAGALNGVVGPATATAYLTSMNIQCVNAGAGAAYGLSVGAGNIGAASCYVYGDDYAAFWTGIGIVNDRASAWVTSECPTQDPTVNGGMNTDVVGWTLTSGSSFAWQASKADENGLAKYGVGVGVSNVAAVWNVEQNVYLCPGTYQLDAEICTGGNVFPFALIGLNGSYSGVTNVRYWTTVTVTVVIAAAGSYAIDISQSGIHGGINFYVNSVTLTKTDGGGFAAGASPFSTPNLIHLGAARLSGTPAGVTPEWSDRSAWDVASFSSRHANDMSASLRHLPAPGTANNFVKDNGVNWASTAPGALTKVDDTNVTLTLGGNPTTALLAATSLTLGWTGTLSPARGGTGKNLTVVNGGVVWTDADSLEVTAAGSAGQLLQSAGAASPVWTTATYPATAAVGGLVVATGANVIGALAVGLTTQVLVGGGAATVPAWSTDLPTGITIGSAYVYRVSGTDVAVADGGTGASTLALNGVLYGNAASAVGVTAAATVAGQVLTAGATPFVPVWTTATYPATIAQGDVLYGSAANVISGLTKDANATRYLSNTGASNNPAWAQIALTTGVTGILPSANGGTGVNNAGTITNASNTTVTGGGTLALAGFTLTVAGTASVIGTNTGDVTLAVNHGLALTNQVIGMGTPSTITSATTNAVTTTTHSHAITAALALIGNGSAQYQLPVTGATPFAPVWTAATGTGAPVLATSPVLVTPTLGVATATSINKVTITAPATGATLTIVEGGSLITAGGAYAITLTATGATGVTLPMSGTLAILGANAFTDSQTIASGKFLTALTDGSAGGLRAGSGSDVLWYRSAADTWRTPDSLIVDGNVGIGCTPGATFEVQGVSGTAMIGRWGGLQAANTVGHYIVIGGGATGTTARGYLGYTHTGSGTATLWGSEPADALGLMSEGTTLLLGDGASAAPSIAIVSGNVGIGCTPQGILDVVQNAGTRLLIAGKKDLTEGTATAIFTIALPTLGMVGGTIFATIEAADATDAQAFTQIVSFAGVVDSAGNHIPDISAGTLVSSKAASGGTTLTTAWTATAAANVMTVKVAPTGSIGTETTYRVTFTIIANTPHLITLA